MGVIVFDDGVTRTGDGVVGATGAGGAGARVVGAEVTGAGVTRTGAGVTGVAVTADGVTGFVRGFLISSLSLNGLSGCGRFNPGMAFEVESTSQKVVFVS